MDDDRFGEQHSSSGSQNSQWEERGGALNTVQDDQFGRQPPFYESQELQWESQEGRQDFGHMSRVASLDSESSNSVYETFTDYPTPSTGYSPWQPPQSYSHPTFHTYPSEPSVPLLVYPSQHVNWDGQHSEPESPCGASLPSPNGEESQPQAFDKNSAGFTCSICEKVFRRNADYVRHHEQVHQKKRTFHCDYPRCPRKPKPFGRKDHWRDHLRDYHHEDLDGRTKSTEKGIPDVNIDWWRCSKCLERIFVTSGWECLQCNLPCKAERRESRILCKKQKVESMNGDENTNSPIARTASKSNVQPKLEPGTECSQCLGHAYIEVSAEWWSPCQNCRPQSLDDKCRGCGGCLLYLFQNGQFWVACGSCQKPASIPDGQYCPSCEGLGYVDGLNLPYVECLRCTISTNKEDNENDDGDENNANNRKAINSSKESEPRRKRKIQRRRVPCAETFLPRSATLTMPYNHHDANETQPPLLRSLTWPSAQDCYDINEDQES